MKPINLIVVPAVFSACLLLAACDSSNVQVVDDESNAGQDAPGTPAIEPVDPPAEDAPGTPAEETPDTPMEVTPDTPMEVTPDTPMEVTPDTPMEVTPDTPMEVTPDTPMEVTPDTPMEVTPDTPMEVTPDTPTVGNPDVPTQAGNLVANGTFENGLADWNQVEPAFESEVSFEGLGAVKLEDFGSITQALAIQPNTRYVVSAYIEGTAIIGIVVGSETITASNTEEDYTFVSFEFDSLAASTAELFARAESETARVDNLEVTSAGDTVTQPEGEPESEPVSGNNIVINGDFENGLAGWDEVEPASESGDSHEGEGSAKLDDTGSISQVLPVDPGSRYRVSARIQGNGTIGILFDNDRTIASGTGDAFELVSFEFDSGDADSVTLFAQTSVGSGTTRVDTFEVIKISDSVDAAISIAPAGAVNLVFNGTFENSLSGWRQVEPAQSSEDTYEGFGSAKVFSLGSISQSIFVIPESRYRVSAYLQGDSILGIEVGNEKFSVAGPAQGEVFEQVMLEFDSGSASTAEFSVQASLSDDNARADNITMVQISGGDGSIAVDPNTVFDFSIWELDGETPITRDGALSFNALDQCVVTPNGNGCRHEIKILQSERYGLTEQYEYFSANIQADLSPGADTIVVQHHPEGTGTLTALYLSDRTNPYGFQGMENGVAYDGIFDVFVTVRIPGTLQNQAVILGTVQSGEPFDYEIINDHGNMIISGLGKRVEVQSANSSISYLKFGNYIQAIDPDSGVRISLDKPLGPEDRASFLQYYANFGIDTATVVFRDILYSRTID